MNKLVLMVLILLMMSASPGVDAASPVLAHANGGVEHSHASGIDWIPVRRIMTLVCALTTVIIGLIAYRMTRHRET